MKKYNVKAIIICMIYLLIFLCFCYAYNIIPLVHDAWASGGYNNCDDFVTFAINCIKTYNSLNGRIIATIVVGFFERSEWLLDVANSLILTCIVYFTVKLFNKQSSIFHIILTWLLLLAVSVPMRTEVYFYATMIYVMPIFLLLLAVMCVKQLEENYQIIFDNNFFCLFLFVSILNSWWLENTSCAYVIVLMVYVTSKFVKNKKINKRLFLIETCSIIVFAIMMFSPGLRTQREFTSNLAIGELIWKNVTLCVQNVLAENKILCILLIIGCLVTLTEKNKKGLFRWSDGLLIAIGVAYVLLFSLNIYWDKMGYGKDPHPILRFGDTMNRGLIIALVGLIAYLLVVLWKCKYKGLCIFYFCGVLSLGPIIVTPNFGVRICYYAVMLLGIITVGLFSQFDINNIRIKQVLYAGIVVFLVLRLDSYVIVLKNIKEIQTERVLLIEYVKAQQKLGKWNYDDTLVLPLFPEEYLYAAASPVPFYDIAHYQAFLNYYDLNENTLVLFSDSRNILKCIERNDTVLLEMQPEVLEEGTIYNYAIMKQNIAVVESGWTEDMRCELRIPEEPGVYYFYCTMQNKEGIETLVYSAKCFIQE